MFQLILPFQLELQFDPDSARQVGGAVAAEPSAAGPEKAPRVRRPRVRPRTQLASPLGASLDAAVGGSEG